MEFAHGIFREGRAALPHHGLLVGMEIPAILAYRFQK